MSQTVLIVEDDKHINEVVAEYMKEAGYIVVSSFRGDIALEILTKNHDIHLFILDIMLPGAGGLELLGAIRHLEYHKEKPVIMLTALSDEATQLLSFDSLADDYVTKPFSPKILVKRANALLRRAGGDEKVLQYENMLLSYERYEVLESGEKVKLTRREFELLGVLMSNVGKVLGRQQLLNHAWGYDYFGDDRIVDVHIKNLRKKLNGNVIHTVKGVGYKFERGN